jgi:hypothetical protein
MGASATWDLAGNLVPSFCLRGALWFSIIVVPWRLFCSAAWAYSWGAIFPLLSFWFALWEVFILLLSCWGYRGHGVFISAAFSGGLYFLGRSSDCLL